MGNLPNVSNLGAISQNSQSQDLCVNLMIKDRLTAVFLCEAEGGDERVAERISDSVQAEIKIRAEVRIVAKDKILNDGKVIEDSRTYS